MQTFWKVIINKMTVFSVNVKSSWSILSGVGREDILFYLENKSISGIKYEENYNQI